VRPVMLCLGVAAALNGQSLPIPKVKPPSRTVAVDSGFQAAHLAIRRWERGYLLGYDLDNSIAMAVDRSGALVLQAKIAPREASHVLMYDVSASPSGTFAVALSGIGPNGGPSGFIALLDHAGRTAQLIQISSGVPYLICFADDGSLWAAVRTFDGEVSGASYEILRRYDGSGRLIGSAVPRNLFAAGLFPGELGTLSASHDKIGLFSSRSRTWVEINSDGKGLRKRVLPGPNSDVASAFLSSNGDVLIRQQEWAAKKGVMKLYQLERSSNTLIEIDQTAIEPGGSMLLGTDGDDLVFLASFSSNLLKWSTYDRSSEVIQK